MIPDFTRSKATVQGMYEPAVPPGPETPQDRRPEPPVPPAGQPSAPDAPPRPENMPLAPPKAPLVGPRPPQPPPAPPAKPQGPPAPGRVLSAPSMAKRAANLLRSGMRALGLSSGGGAGGTVAYGLSSPGMQQIYDTVQSAGPPAGAFQGLRHLASLGAGSVTSLLGGQQAGVDTYNTLTGSNHVYVPPGGQASNLDKVQRNRRAGHALSSNFTPPTWSTPPPASSSPYSWGSAGLGGGGGGLGGYRGSSGLGGAGGYGGTGGYGGGTGGWGANLGGGMGGYSAPATYTPTPQLFDMSSLSRFVAQPASATAHPAPTTSLPIASGSSLPMPRHASTEVAPRVPDSLASRAESFQKLAAALLDHPCVAGFFQGCADNNLTDEQVLRGVQKLAEVPGGKEGLQVAMEKAAVWGPAIWGLLKLLGSGAASGAAMWGLGRLFGGGGGEEPSQHPYGPHGRTPDWVNNPASAWVPIPQAPTTQAWHPQASPQGFQAGMMNRPVPGVPPIPGVPPVSGGLPGHPGS